MAYTRTTPQNGKTPRIPKGRGPTDYPAPAGRGVPMNARREMYETFRAHMDEVREVLVSILRDEEADAGHRIQAGKEILSRGYGAVPNIEIVEQVFKHEHSLDMDALRNLPKKDLDALEAVLTRFIKVDADAIDAEVIESDP